MTSHTCCRLSSWFAEPCTSLPRSITEALITFIDIYACMCVCVCVCVCVHVYVYVL